MRRTFALAISLALHAVLILAFRFDPSPAPPAAPVVVAVDLTALAPVEEMALPIPDLPPDPALPAFEPVAAAATSPAPPAPLLPPPDDPPAVTIRELRPVPSPPSRPRSPAPARPRPAASDLSERARQDYVLEVVRRLSGAQVSLAADGSAQADGVVVVRLTVARDGSLLHVALMRDSGSAAFDQHLLDAIRQLAPFGPLPGDSTTDRLSFVVPIAFARRAP